MLMPMVVSVDVTHSALSVRLSSLSNVQMAVAGTSVLEMSSLARRSTATMPTLSVRRECLYDDQCSLRRDLRGRQ